MNPIPTNPIPDVYVLWHPRCALGEMLAKKIYAWLRPGNGLGPQVYYRSLPAPKAPSLPPPLPGENFPRDKPPAAASPVSNMQIVLPLIDENMIADPAWRHWLKQLADSKQATVREFLPVALDSTAYNAPEGVRDKNYLRPSGTAVATLTDAAREVIARSLLKQLTEAMSRLMLGTVSQPATKARRKGAGKIPARGVAVPKVKVFLSHAKIDGTVPARRIRDYIYSQTQLAAFYDENDIPFSSVFDRVLNQGVLGAETAALIAVRSAHYASRPWCRRELSLFRRPIPATRNAETAVRWRLNPVVVVEAMESGGRTVGIPELGNAPLIRWAEAVPDQEEQIVTTLMRDAVLAAFHGAVGGKLERPPEENCVVLNWLPDPTTLLHIPRVRATLARKASGKTPSLRVFYPGRGFSGLELTIFGEIFPNVEFVSFEQILS